MCGIVGMLGACKEITINRAVLDGMNESQYHHGSDEGGIRIEPGSASNRCLRLLAGRKRAIRVRAEIPNGSSPSAADVKI